MKPKTLLAFGLTAVAMLAASLAFSQSVDDPLDPIKVAGDTHKLALDNKFVRVLDVHLPPGKIEPRHRHPHGMSVTRVVARPRPQSASPILWRVINSP